MVTFVPIVDNIDELLDDAQKKKAVFYGKKPTVTPERLEREVKAAKDQFAHFMNQENERVQKLVDVENERIVTDLENNNESTTCLICLEVLYPVVSYENRAKNRSHMACCGAVICKQCHRDYELNQIFKSKKMPRCANCRNAELPNSKKFAKQAIKDKKHWALSYLANSFLTGECGKEKDVKKAFAIFFEAAQAGSASSQTMMSHAFYHGDFHGRKLKKSIVKAKRWAKLAAEQGAPPGNLMLAIIMEAESGNANLSDEAVRHFMLAAYAGEVEARERLGSWYFHQWNTSGMTYGMDDLRARRDMCLALYWQGKSADVKTRAKSLFLFASLLEEAMKLWHVRRFPEIEPHPGYSHVPFCHWAFRQDKKISTKFLQRYDYWKKFCVNCGCRKKDKLMACARCKTFHYCSRECQVKHWKAGHKVDCKAHWIESFFPNIRNPNKLEYNIDESGIY